jgi:hypothetical protein
MGAAYRHHMGLFTDRRVDVIADEAAKAYAAGLSVFTPRLTVPTVQHDRSAHITAWAEMVASIETAGWRLEHWSVSGHGGDAEAYPIFRRA